MNKKWRGLALSGFLAGACWLAGCVGGGVGDPYLRPSASSGIEVFVAPEARAIKKVTVMPLKAETELIGNSVADMVMTQLLRSGKYEVMERSRLNQVLGEAELAMSGLSDSKLADLGAMMGAEAVVTGTVEEYGTVAARGKTLPSVALSVRLVDCASGKVLWSVEAVDRADSGGVTVSQHARDLVRRMMVELYKNLP